MRLTEVSEDAVLQAMAECDELGREAFLAKHGFRSARYLLLVHDGQRYDSKAIVAVAHGIQFPDEPPLTPDDLSGGKQTTAVLRRLGFEVVDERGELGQIANDTRSTWWVNQGMTYAAEREGGYVWAPQKTKSGFPVAHHTSVSKLQPGDAVVHYANSRIRALSRVVAPPSDRARPDGLPEGPWESAGHYCEVEYFDLEDPIALAEIKTRSADAGPFASDGSVKQGYLFPISDELAVDLEAEFADRWPAGSPWGRGEQSMRALAVYVGDASLANFQFSASRGKWGWKTMHSDYEAVESGDTILFCVGHDGGGPRQPAESFLQGTARSLVIGRINSRIAAEDQPFWPDEQGHVVYPYRLDFEVLEDRGAVSLKQINEEFGAETAEAFRRSGNEQGRGVLLSMRSTPPPPPSPPPPPTRLSSVVEQLSSGLREAGLDYGARHDELLRTFATSLATKRFLLLTGLSGSGKTRLALGFGQWLGADRYKVVAVRPDWTGPDSLLGYEDGLSLKMEGQHAWIVPDALEFMLRAANDPSNPYLLLLDEMNLAHVERYFADVLSGMESNEPILPNLAKTETGDWRLADSARLKIPFPTNLLVVGTVNIDETTYMFSPKVLDRANTIEFRVAATDLQESVDPPREVEAGDPEAIKAFLEAATDRGPALPPPAAELATWLRSLHELLAKHDREFGHRTFFEALRFSALLASAGDSDPITALDLQVMQKVLPRFHGSARQVGGVLQDVGAWCFHGPDAKRPDETAFDLATADAATAALPRSFEKLQRMSRRLAANHFVSFAE